MRVSLLATAALLCACSSGDGQTVPRAADALDCTFVKNENGENCWLAMAKTVEACLGATTDFGILAPDRLSCTYWHGRRVNSAHRLGEEVESDKVPPTRDVTVSTREGVQCVRVQEADRVVTVTYSGGTVVLSTAHDPVTLTCPDGSVFKGPQADLQGCLSPSSGVPGYYWSRALVWSAKSSTYVSSRATFGLLGSSIPLYACRPFAVD